MKFWSDRVSSLSFRGKEYARKKNGVFELEAQTVEPFEMDQLSGMGVVVYSGQDKRAEVAPVEEAKAAPAPAPVKEKLPPVEPLKPSATEPGWKADKSFPSEVTVDMEKKAEEPKLVDVEDMNRPQLLQEAAALGLRLDMRKSLENMRADVKKAREEA